MSNLLRLVIIAGYSLIAVTALYLFTTLEWVPRKVITAFFFAAALMWSLFYILAVPAFETSPDLQSFVAFMSRLSHIPTIAAFGMVLYIMAMSERR